MLPALFKFSFLSSPLSLLHNRNCVQVRETHTEKFRFCFSALVSRTESGVAGSINLSRSTLAAANRANQNRDYTETTHSTTMLSQRHFHKLKFKPSRRRKRRVPFRGFTSLAAALVSEGLAKVVLWMRVFRASTLRKSTWSN